MLLNYTESEEKMINNLSDTKRHWFQTNVSIGVQAPDFYKWVEELNSKTGWSSEEKELIIKVVRNIRGL